MLKSYTLLPAFKAPRKTGCRGGTPSRTAGHPPASGKLKSPADFLFCLRKKKKGGGGCHERAIRPHRSFVPGAPSSAEAHRGRELLGPKTLGRGGTSRELIPPAAGTGVPRGRARPAPAPRGPIVGAGTADFPGIRARRGGKTCNPARALPRTSPGRAALTGWWGAR